MMDRIRLGWAPRVIPLPIRAVAATGAAASDLGRRLAALDDDALGALAAVAGAGLLVVIGDALPWVDGVAYLGRDPAAPSLLLPTALTPTVPAAALERAVLARIAAAPVALLPSTPAASAALYVRCPARPPSAAAWPVQLVPCEAARSIDRRQLAAWLTGGSVRAPDPGAAP